MPKSARPLLWGRALFAELLHGSRRGGQRCVHNIARDVPREVVAP